VPPDPLRFRGAAIRTLRSPTPSGFAGRAFGCSGFGRSAFGRSGSDAHDEVTAVDVDDFAGDPGGHRRGEEERGVADLAQLDVAPERRLLGVVLQHAGEAAD